MSHRNWGLTPIIFLALDAVCVTNNTREFERIEGLKLEDWLKPANAA